MSDTLDQQELGGDAQQMSPEQIAKMRKNMLDYYNEQIPFLKKQKEYEILVADIEEARARRMTMTIRMAQMMAGPPPDRHPDGELETPPPAPEGTTEERPKRQLKKEDA